MRVTRFAGVVFWGFLIAIGTASQLYHSTKIRELRTEVDKLKTERTYPAPSPTPIKKRRNR